MGEAGPLVVLWMHKHLSFPDKAPEWLRVKYPVSVALETCSQLIRLLSLPTVAGTDRKRGSCRLALPLEILAKSAVVLNDSERAAVGRLEIVPIAPMSGAYVLS